MVEDIKIKAVNKKKYTLLYVDDEEHNLRVFKSSFRKYYNVLTTVDPREAIEIVKDQEVDLLVTDQKMPFYQGTELIQEIHKTHPDLMSIIITGFSDISDITKAINECGIHKYVTKPWEYGELKMNLDNALELYNLKNEKEALLQEVMEATTNLETLVQNRTEEIREKNDRIQESLRYALTIQRSLLPDMEPLKKYFQDYFLLYRPLEIVSGDFFYMHDTGSHLILGAFDCTGHGVPGALLSVIGTTTLDSIVKEKRIYDAAIILKLLNDHIYDHLKTDDKIDEAVDGMEGVLLVIDNRSGEMQVAGAKGDLLIITRANPDESTVIKGNRFSLGTKRNLPIREIASETLKLDAIKNFYLFSDGFRDQFSEDNEKKLGYKEFKNLIHSNHHRNITDQEDQLNVFLDQWKGANDQTDDIMVIGLETKFSA